MTDRRTPPSTPRTRRAAAPVLLETPAEGVPHVVESERGLDEAAAAVAGGEGPVAIDAERASGYRYGQRAYLVQVRREGAGTWLVDPVAVPDLTPLAEAIGPAEWILHAATQDLACLAEVGLRPRQLFDTELAARILGLPRVGLSAVVEHYLGLRLAKEHSAVDWSTRPLPEPWLRYAALDVEVLGELRNLMGVDLAVQGKDEWARQEFAALLSWTPTERVDPWRRTSGINTLRSRRAVAVVRELWYTRDDIARDRDTSIGRVLPDTALVEIARVAPRSTSDLPERAPGHRPVRPAVGRGGGPGPGPARGRAATALAPPDGPPPPRVWADKNPVAAERLKATRAALTGVRRRARHPGGERLLPRPPAPGRVDPPADRDAPAFEAALAEHGVRPWQAEIVAPMLAAAFAAHPDG